LQLGPQHQVHVFHGDCPQPHLIAQHHFAALQLAEAQLDGQVFGDAQVHGATVGLG
jgi:hypothetical protein